LWEPSVPVPGPISNNRLEIKIYISHILENQSGYQVFCFFFLLDRLSQNLIAIDLSKAIFTGWLLEKKNSKYFFIIYSIFTSKNLQKLNVVWTHAKFQDHTYNNMAWDGSLIAFQHCLWARLNLKILANV
jgi:hypothetical protein